MSQYLDLIYLPSIFLRNIVWPVCLVNGAFECQSAFEKKNTKFQKICQFSRGLVKIALGIIASLNSNVKESREVEDDIFYKSTPRYKATIFEASNLWGRGGGNLNRIANVAKYSVNNIEDFCDRLRATNSSDVVALTVHGSPHTFGFEYMSFNVYDEFPSNCFVNLKNTLIILESCFTGLSSGGIAQYLANKANTTVIAPPCQTFGFHVNDTDINDVYFGCDNFANDNITILKGIKFLPISNCNFNMAFASDIATSVGGILLAAKAMNALGIILDKGTDSIVPYGQSLAKKLHIPQMVTKSIYVTAKVAAKILQVPSFVIDKAFEGMSYCLYNTVSYTASKIADIAKAGFGLVGKFFKVF
jgi:hypothetical protein